MEFKAHYFVVNKLGISMGRVDVYIGIYQTQKKAENAVRKLIPVWERDNPDYDVDTFEVREHVAYA